MMDFSFFLSFLPLSFLPHPFFFFQASKPSNVDMQKGLLANRRGQCDTERRSHQIGLNLLLMSKS